jgi:hypothetical protein
MAFSRKIERLYKIVGGDESGDLGTGLLATVFGIERYSLPGKTIGAAPVAFVGQKYINSISKERAFFDD